MFIDAPDFFTIALGVSRIDWTWDEPATVNIAAYTADRSVAAQPWRSAAKASVQLGTIAGAANIRAIRSFLRRCRGQVNHFRLAASVGAQNANAGVTIAADASAGDRTLSLAGYDAALLDGQFATVGGQLLLLVADQDGDTITFEPMLREDVAAGTAIETARPYALVYMAASSVCYSTAAPRAYGITFDVVEAVGESDG